MVKKLRHLVEKANELAIIRGHKVIEDPKESSITLRPMRILSGCESIENEHSLVRLSMDEFSKTLNKLTKVAKIYRIKPSKEHCKLTTGEYVD